MNKETNKLIPELRFPEFVNDGEWEEKSICDITTSESSSMALNKLDLKSIGYPVYGADSIVGYIDEYQQKGKYISIVKDGSGVGRLNLCESKSSILGTLTCLKSKNQKNYDLIWIYYLLNTVDFSSYVKGSGIPHIYYSDFKNENIAIPKPNEQQKIASCLTSLDEAIANHSQKLEALKSHKKGLMQNLFPQEGETVPKYRFREFKEPLKKIGFAELGEIKIGLTHKPDYIETGIPFLSSRNISGGFIDFKNIQHISKEKFDSMPKSTKPKVGDILFTRVGSNLGNPIILEVDIKFGIFVSLGFFRVNKKAYNYYIKYWMESDLFWKQVNQKVAGGAKDNLNSNWLKEFELYIPSIEEQQRIASCLSSLNTLIKAQAEKIEQLKLHKRGLMQRLFPKIYN